jgi:hypothetical protein
LKPAFFPEMSAFTGLTRFCIRYTKMCQANYPGLFQLLDLAEFVETKTDPQKERKRSSKWTLQKTSIARLSILW